MDLLKRILALAGVVILVMCYVMSFITGIMATEDSHNWFVASIGATILIPTVLYGYSLIVKMSNRNDQESRLREDAYLRLMKEQLQKEKQASENANAVSADVNTQMNVNAQQVNANTQANVNTQQMNANTQANVNTQQMNVNAAMQNTAVKGQSNHGQ